MRRHCHGTINNQTIKIDLALIADLPNNHRVRSFAQTKKNLIWDSNLQKNIKKRYPSVLCLRTAH